MNRLRRFYHWAKVPPEGVEKAPRRERWKRQAWMYLSSIIAGAISVASVYAYWGLFGDPATEAGQWLLVLGFVLLFGYIDVKLFGWGMRYFGLIPPWQFRVDADRRTGGGA